MIVKVKKNATIRNQYNQIPHLTQENMTHKRAKRSALSQPARIRQGKICFVFAHFAVIWLTYKSCDAKCITHGSFRSPQLRTCVIKIATFKGDQLMWYNKLLIKERISSLWGQILSFKRISQFQLKRITT